MSKLIDFQNSYEIYKSASLLHVLKIKCNNKIIGLELKCYGQQFIVKGNDKKGQPVRIINVNSGGKPESLKPMQWS